MLLPTGPLCQLQLSRFHHRPRGRHPGPRGRPSPPRRDRERHPRPRIKCGAGSQVRRRAQPSPLGPFRRQRRLAGRPKPAPYSIRGDGPQPGTLDRAHRSARAGVHHQNPAATLLLPGRTHHSQSTPPHPASSPGLTLAKPVRQRPGTIALPATPVLTAPSAFDLSTMTPHAWPISLQAGPLTLSAFGRR